MLDWSTMLIFVTASLALLVVPGPAVLYIVARSIDQGRVAGIVSVLGIALGSMVHIMAAALGVSALLLSSALAFSIFKYLGAAYLIYLGVRKLMEKDAVHQVEQPEPTALSRIFTQGVIVNILNPKTALFFFAFLPQFVDPNRGSVAVQVMLLGAIFTVLAVFSDSIYALLAGTIRQYLKDSLAFLRAQRYFSGSVYILLGVATALSGSEQK